MELNTFKTFTIIPEARRVVNTDVTTANVSIGDYLTGTAYRFDNNAMTVHVSFGNDVNGIIFKDDFTYLLPSKDCCADEIAKAMVFAVSKNVYVKVIDILPDGTLRLSRRETMVETVKSFNEGDIVQAHITSIRHFGCFVDLGNGITTLINVRDLSKARYANIRNWVQEGTLISARIQNITFDESGFEIIASRKAAYSEMVSLHPGDVVTLKISGKLNGGYFCEYTPALSGIVDIPYGVYLYEGQEVSATLKKIRDGEKLQFAFISTK